MALGLRRIVINMASGTGARIFALFVSFLTTPILINHLGLETFGLWTIINTLPAYAGLLDFGIGPGLVRHFTEYSESGDKVSVRHIMTLSISFYLALGLVLMPLVYWLAPDIVRLFTISEYLRQSAETSLLIVFSYFVVSCLVGVFSSRLVSMHRMDISSAIGLVSQIIYAVMVIIIIPRSPTIMTAVWLTGVQLLVFGVLTYAAVWQIDRQMYSNPFAIPRLLTRKLLVFGGWMQLNSVASLVSLEADKIIIGGFVGMAAVTPYQIGNRLASLNRMIPLQLLSVLMPMATIIQVGRSREGPAEFYTQMSRYLMLLTMLITGFTATVADRLIVIWIGRPYPTANLIVVALAVSYAINNLTGGGTTMVRAAGQPRYETYYAMLGMVLNVGLTVALAPLFGLAGIIAGTILANVIGSAYFLILFHRRFAIPWFKTMGSWLWRLLLATFVACLSLWIAQSMQPHGGRLIGLALLALNGLIYVAVFAAMLTVLHFWTDQDTAVFRRVLIRVVPSKIRTR